LDHVFPPVWVLAERAQVWTGDSRYALDQRTDIEMFLDEPCSMNATIYPDRVAAAMKDGVGKDVVTGGEADHSGFNDRIDRAPGSTLGVTCATSPAAGTAPTFAS
jgi:hypothetical protein